MRYLVSAHSPERLVLQQTDPVESALQNIGLLLRTRKGSCPFYREFGISMEFLDRPVTVSRPLILAEAKEAVEEFEPRAQVLNVTLEEDPEAPGRVFPVLEVELLPEP